MIDGEMKQLLVHRKGSTRAFPPHHPLIPVDYQLTGQPVLIGGTMGTNSYVLTGKALLHFVHCTVTHVPTQDNVSLTRGCMRRFAKTQRKAGAPVAKCEA